MNGSSLEMVSRNAQVKKQPLRLVIVVVVISDDANGARATTAFVTRYESVERDLSRKNVDEDLTRVSFGYATSLHRFYFNSTNRLDVQVRESIS